MKEAYLEVISANLSHNFKWYKSVSLNKFICPMIKANAYGVGEKTVLKILTESGADCIGVARLSEALSVRSVNPKVKVLLFNSCSRDEYIAVLKNNITPVVSSFDSLNDLCGVSEDLGVDVSVHIEVDTGMSRLGFLPSQIYDLFKILKLNNNIKIEGVFSHFISANDWPDKNKRSIVQFLKFKNCINEFDHFKNENRHLFAKEAFYHLASSKALNNYSFKSSNNEELLHFGLRPGLGLYGISQDNINLKEVLRLKAPIIDLKWIEKGESVSYDATWVANKKTLIGVLPIGYADGYPRALSNKTYVIINGKKALGVGSICMDFMMVDVTEQSDSIRVNDVALLFGSDKGHTISIEDLSERAGMITYELLVGLNHRLKRLEVEL